MATYVLVHGAFHGGWAWKKVTPLLRAYGHEAYAPTLTGLGERAHLYRPEINLSTHVQDVVAVLEYEDLRDVVLVGHSYGGMVITGVAERVPERLRHLFYLDAFVPQDGQAMVDLVPGGRSRYTYGEDGRMVPFSLDRLGISDPADGAWVEARLVPHPVGCITEPLRVANPAAAALPRSFVFCKEHAASAYGPVAARARAEGWKYHELPSGHDAMITHPNQVADLLLELA